MKKLFSLIFVLLLVLLLPASAFAEENMLTVTGNGVEQTITLSYDELNSIGGERYIYTSYNNWPTAKTYYAQVVPLSMILDMAGLKADATIINIAAAPNNNGGAGYNVSFLLTDLLAKRYSFVSGRQEVPAGITIKEFNDNFQTTVTDKMRFIYGQLDKQEQTSPQFVQDASIITVTCDKVRQLPIPTATVTSNADGTYSVTLNSSIADAKLYYTVNGGPPSVHSTMYNISAERWQPELNVPFSVEGSSLVKVVAVASGWQDSEVYTFTPADLATNSGKLFDDVPVSYWAADEINFLVQHNILLGMGDNKFQPEGTLTRAQFSKMMVLAINGTEPPTANKISFSDVQIGSWYMNYVAEAAKLGLFDGYPDGSFRPNAPVSKQEMITVTMRAMEQGEANAAEAAAGERTFTTSGGISIWAAGYVEYAYDLNMIPDEMLSMKGGQLNLAGTSGATRAEAAYLVKHFLDRQ